MTVLAPPAPDAAASWQALRALIAGRNLLEPLAALHARLGDVFDLPVPGFSPVVLAGPEAARFVLVEEQAGLRWRMERDPVARLLRHGVLVEDGAAHDTLRRLMTPALHRRFVESQAAAFQASADQVSAAWRDGQTVTVAPAMRRIALSAITRSLFGADISPSLDQLWQPILRSLAYISPGLWVLWPGIPRPSYRRALARLDSYLYGLIRGRRAAGTGTGDLLDLLIDGGLDDALIRDQLLTMLIAGHDTSTAALSWSLYMLGSHPAALEAASAEARSGAGRPAFLARVIKETLRLYPPIHAGLRQAARDLEFQGRRIPAGTRVLFSIYLTHRHPDYWRNPERFDPGRFDPDKGEGPQPFSYLPFGGGPRFCIGAALAQLEIEEVLTRLLAQFDFELLPGKVHAHMGATLEPGPALKLRVRRRG